MMGRVCRTGELLAWGGRLKIGGVMKDESGDKDDDELIGMHEMS